MTLENTLSVISVMLAVIDTPAAIVWYKKAPGATELWNFGSVAGLNITGAFSSWVNQLTMDHDMKTIKKPNQKNSKDYNILQSSHS